MKWMGYRECQDGTTLRDRMTDPKLQSDGWYTCLDKKFRETELPTVSEGPFANKRNPKPNWETFVHSPKPEALYAILTSCIKASKNLEDGARFNSEKGVGKRDVYLGADTEEGRELASLSYGRFSPSLGNGTFWEVQLVVLCDTNWRNPYKHSSQWCQIPNEDCPGYVEGEGGPSMYVVEYRFRICPWDKIPKGHEYSVIWNPAFEAVPDFIKRREGYRPPSKVSAIVWGPEFQHVTDPEQLRRLAREQERAKEPAQNRLDRLERRTKDAEIRLEQLQLGAAVRESSADGSTTKLCVRTQRTTVKRKIRLGTK